MNFILMKDSMVISDMLYILQHFDLNVIQFFIVNVVALYKKILSNISVSITVKTLN